MKKNNLVKDAIRRIGRPLSFDRDEALKLAMLTFWQHGYETTSISDLTAAMGVTAPSIYAAFGNKQKLFIEAVNLYIGNPELVALAIKDAPTALEAARDLMISAAIAYTGETTPQGCLLASATASGSVSSAEVRTIVADIRKTLTNLLRKRIASDVAKGLLPINTDTAALATLVMAILPGLSVLARDGIPRACLLSVVDASLSAWPVMSREL